MTFCVYNKKTITTLGEIGKDINVHLFFNTGMNREGIQEDQLVDILEEIKKFPTITVEGVMSHLYSADEIEYDGIEEQIKKFRTMYYKLVDYGHAPTWRHIGNSAGIFKINDDFFNAFRPGISLYGYSPFASHAPLHKKAKPLKPALSVSSRVISTQIARPGEGVSYNHTYKPYDRELCATIPFGYGEGLPRAASGKLMMKCGRQWIKQIGTICMNLCTCKSDAEVAIGDKVEIISNIPDAKNSMDQLAQASETIVYECLVRLDKSIRREII